MEGIKIRINHLAGEDSRYDGKEGFITSVDDLGQLHGTWGGLAVIPGEDDYEIIYVSPHTDKIQIEVSNPVFVSSNNPQELEEEEFNAHTESYDEKNITFGPSMF